ncbi:MAG: cyclopropane fatty acyl phospholipid synthase [Candidatus Neomarinimicrobiota bacterium]
MQPRKSEAVARDLFAAAGITFNGTEPHDPQVHNQRFYHRLLRDGALGFGESYMEGWWDCDDLVELVNRIYRGQLDTIITGNWRTTLHVLRTRLFNLQKLSRAFQVAQQHYDVGNDLYRAMLDRRMVYSCGYWREAEDLDAAQEAKLDLVCRKLSLEPGMSLLDLGCGWGALAKYAAEKFGVQVVGLTISQNQMSLGRELCRGLPVEIRLLDYRKVQGLFDRVVSIGFFEHVGHLNYRTYMNITARCMKPEGIALLHTIGGNRSVTTTNRWVAKYIFPNSLLPSIAQIGKAMEGLLVMEDWHNFGPDYERTTIAWHDNFEAAWDTLKASYDERFRRMWRFYLLTAAGGFRSREQQLWQIVLTHPGRRQPKSRLN